MSSYFVDIEMTLDGTTIKSSNHIYLHDQLYHYLTNPVGGTPPPPYEGGGGPTREAPGCQGASGGASGW